MRKVWGLGDNMATTKLDIFIDGNWEELSHAFCCDYMNDEFRDYCNAQLIKKEGKKDEWLYQMWMWNDC